MVTLCCFFPTGICAIIAAVNVSAILAEIRTRKKCYTEEINDLIESTLKFEVNHASYFLIDVIFLQARSQFLAGDTEGARSSNAWARGLTFASIGFGVAWIGVVIALYIWVWSVATSLNGY